MAKHSRIDALVVGGGAWGTTLATLMARGGRRVRMWVRDRELAREINLGHTNDRYLSGFELPPDLRAVVDLKRAVRCAPVILMVVPSKHFRAVARTVGEVIEGDQVLVHATKGIEEDSFKRMSQVLSEETCTLKTGVLTGPNLAREIMAGDPAGALVASRFEAVVEAVQPLFAGCNLRVYGGSDVIGAEVGGAFKNIIALAAGAADGMGLGANAKALLLTRGLIEMARFGAALGARVHTFVGLAGIGDLI
ncbi:MAG: NAD(P)-dependent glycerol-3-phosphate dehydrogenase, partial [Deltaproteobacteria bacterium]|nr:NAD(P)-dependent glycerol-3-phosphate dehydrogenase [Deltaproteobacteria bacterium]